MNQNNTYTYLITMPTKFNWYMIDWGSFDVDLYNNPDGDNEKQLLSAFYSFYGPAWGDKIRFSDIPKIATLMQKYNYTIEHRYNFSVLPDEVNMKLEIKTEAMGQHLETFLDEVLNEYFYSESGCSEWITEAKIKKHGWQDFNVKSIIKCTHSYERLQIMNDKDGSIVEVLECSKCKELSKRII